MNIYIATDHAGYAHKEKLKIFFEEENRKGHLYKVIDCGAYELDLNDDYTVYIHKAMLALTRDWQIGEMSRAIIFGGSGQGEAMVANRYIGVRATTYYGYDTEIVRLGREHNDANVLSIGARFVGPIEMCNVVRIFLETAFSGDERHVRRIAQINLS